MAVCVDTDYVLTKLAWMREQRIWPNGLRYLWTDAFGVILLASLHRQLNEDKYFAQAEWVVTEVERVRGRGIKNFSLQQIADVAASFQAAVVDVLRIKLRRAAQRTGAKTLILGGGVSANSALRAASAQLADKMRCRLRLPAPEWPSSLLQHAVSACRPSHRATSSSDITTAPYPLCWTWLSR